MALGESHPPAPRRPQIPDYELLRLIGSGSYGDVWLARGVTGILRAVKVVWRERFDNDAPFEREFRGLKEFAAISLQTAGQMALLHVGRNEAAGFFYYVMELADDATGAHVVDPATYVPLTMSEWRARRGRIPAGEVTAAGAELAEALAALHAHGLVHRDIKPSNAILVKGRAKLADIGLVTPAHDARTFIGTSGYVPPEGPGAPAADVFALGRMLYELATGLDREEFPRLPPELAQWADRAELMELNEVLLRAGAARADARYPDARALAADLNALQNGRSLRARRNRRWMLGLGAVAAVVAAGLFLDSRRDAPPAGAPRGAPVDPRVIAVLPFENLVEEADERFLAEGLAEEVRMALGRIEAFRVIGRTSVLPYADPRARRLPEIARTLGVGAVIEGTVQPVENRIRVAVRLTEPGSGRQLWAESYERAIDDVFTVQTGIAAEVARALHATLTPRERARMEELPTRNALAYSLYVRAKLRRSELDATHGESALAAWDEVVRMLEEAVTADPGFAAAYALLSRIHASIYFFSSLDASPTRKERARQALGAAARLAPDAPETWFARGRFAYACERDFPEASRLFERAAMEMPNDGELLFNRGIVARRLGRLDEAAGLLTQALEVNPLDLGTAATLLQTLNMTGRYAQAVEVGERYTGTTVLHAEIAQLTSYSRFQIDGDAARYLEIRGKAPLRGSDPHGLVRAWFGAVLGGDYEAAARIVADPRFPNIPALDGVVPEPPALNRAYAARLLGRDAEAAVHAREAVSFYEQGNWTPQQQWVIKVKLMEAAAYGGQIAEAKRLAAEVRESLTGADQLNERNIRALLWRVYAEIGENDLALEILAEMKRDGAAISAHFARIDPAWRKVANDPRFEALLPLPPTSKMQRPLGVAGER